MRSRIKLVGVGLLTVAVGALGGVAVTGQAMARTSGTASTSQQQAATIEVPESLVNLKETTITERGYDDDSGDAFSKDHPGFALEKAVAGKGYYYARDPKTGNPVPLVAAGGSQFASVESIELTQFYKPGHYGYRAPHDVDMYFQAAEFVKVEGTGGDNPPEVFERVETGAPILVASYRMPRKFTARNVEFVEMRRDSSNRHMPVFKVKDLPQGKDLTYVLFNAELSEKADDSEFLVDGNEMGNKVTDPNGGVTFTMDEKSEDMLRVNVRSGSGSGGSAKGDGTFLASVSLLEK